MQKIHIASAALVLVSSAFAQTTSTLPIGYDTVTGGDISQYALGRYADGRAQICYGDLQIRTQTLVVSRLSFRRETKSGNPNTARTWSNISLTIGEHDFAKHTDTYTENLLKPKLVFSSSMTWPATSGFPASTPAPWGEFAKKDDLQFPFSAAHVHPAGKGFAAQFDFTGGVLANGAGWSGSTNAFYYIDGIANANCTNTAGVFIFGRDANCKVQTAYDPYMATWLHTDHLPGGKAQYRWQWYDYYMPQNANILGVISFNDLSAAPVSNFLGSCYKLYVDPTKPMLFFPHVTDKDGHWFDSFRNVPYVAAWAGTGIWTQAAYDHNKKFELSTAIRADIQTLPTATPRSYSFRLYYPDKSRDVGYGPYNTGIPVIKLH